MDPKTKKDIELAIAAFLIVAWQATVCYAALAGKSAIGYLATVIFGMAVYIGWRADKEEKARLRRRQAQRENLDKALADLEQWRKERS